MFSEYTSRSDARDSTDQIGLHIDMRQRTGRGNGFPLGSRPGRDLSHSARPVVIVTAYEFDN